MRRPTRRRSPSRLILLSALSLLASVAGTTTASAVAPGGRSIDAPTDARPASRAVTPAGATQLLPDLRMALLRGGEAPRGQQELYIERTPSNEVLLRFTTVVFNIGAGPFQVNGNAMPVDPTTMSTKQVIYNDQGGNVRITTGAIAKFGGDGHDHWHIQQMQRYQLWSRDEPDPPVLVGYKTGFCFFDGRHKRPDLPGSPTSPRYGISGPRNGCGDAPNETKIRMGLSVGWGDVYPWNIAHQWIDVTEVPNGDYRVCVTVDPQGFYTESNTGNNQVWNDITLDVTANPPTVTTTQRAWAPCS